MNGAAQGTAGPMRRSATEPQLAGGPGLLRTAAYGLFAMPLAMAALPLYVHLPKFYGGTLGVDLAVLGVVLLVLRLLDGLVDPLLGVWSDRLRSRRVAIALSAPVLAAGMVALFMPPAETDLGRLAWLVAALTLVYTAYSVAMINHNAWGAELTTDPVGRTRITAIREGLALIGVVVASVAPALLGGAAGPDAGLAPFAIAFAVFTLACAAVTLRAPNAPRRAEASLEPLATRVAAPLADPLFRRLLAVFLANGIASAIPATLVLFFVADVLQAESRQGLFLALYFVAGGVGMPLWVRLSAAWGKTRAWMAGMVAAIVAFVWAFALGPGDTGAFAAICVLSGLALGADLALPPSLLADVIDRDGRARPTGAYFGLWTLATKLNLALAAGIALPLLALLGYAPGGTGGGGLGALAFVYAVVPCALKLGALFALYRFETAAARHLP
ncbi:MAG TPA: MFS transporter [Casimicrobiaceae bacterium]|nr:MFS transporter [Casimicrobiaceae bacterium]